MARDDLAGGSSGSRTDTDTVSRADFQHLQRHYARVRQQRDNLRGEVTDLQAQNQQLRKALQNQPTAAALALPDPEFKDPANYQDERDQHPHHKLFPKDRDALSLADRWQLVGASCRGRGHAYKGAWRDDDFAVRSFAHGRGVAVAIADGLGIKPFSRWGARAASHGALWGARALNPSAPIEPEESWLIKLTQLVDQVGAPTTGQHQRSDKDMQALCTERDTHASRTLISMLQKARNAVVYKADKHGKSTDELHSTLLLFLAIPHHRDYLYIASAQIGDGALYACVRQRGDTSWILPEPPQASGIDNQVQPFMTVPPTAYKDLIHTTDLVSPLRLLAMTDGTLDDLDWDPDENGRFRGIQGYYEELEHEVHATKKPAEGLDRFLGYYRINSLDDRTNVCMYRN